MRTAFLGKETVKQLRLRTAFLGKETVKQLRLRTAFLGKETVKQQRLRTAFLGKETVKQLRLRTAFFVSTIYIYIILILKVQLHFDNFSKRCRKHDTFLHKLSLHYDFLLTLFSDF